MQFHKHIYITDSLDLFYIPEKEKGAQSELVNFLSNNLVNYLHKGLTQHA